MKRRRLVSKFPRCEEGQHSPLHVYRNMGVALKEGVMKHLWLNERRQRDVPIPFYGATETEWHRQLHAMLADERKRKAQREGVEVRAHGTTAEDHSGR